MGLPSAGGAGRSGRTASACEGGRRPHERCKQVAPRLRQPSYTAPAGHRVGTALSVGLLLAGFVIFFAWLPLT
jgi:hypothetical protein